MQDWLPLWPCFPRDILPRNTDHTNLRPALPRNSPFHELPGNGILPHLEAHALTPNLAGLYGTVCHGSAQFDIPSLSDRTGAAVAVRVRVVGRPVRPRR